MEGTLSDHPGMFAAGQPRLLRAINERTILELIRRTGTTSRAQIARESGLSKPTVSLALGGLIEAGLVHEVGRATGGKGPSAVLYELNPAAGWVVGIDVGRHWVRAAAADITGAIVARRDERARARSSATLIGQIAEIAREVAGDAGIPFEPDELAAKLQLVLSLAESERDRLRQRAMDRVRANYSWDAVTDAYEELLRKLVG